MAEATQNTAQTTKGKPTSKKKLRALGRKKRDERLTTDPEFKKAYFDAKSKRSTERKTGFRKKKRGK